MTKKIIFTEEEANAIGIFLQSFNTGTLLKNEAKDLIDVLENKSLITTDEYSSYYDKINVNDSYIASELFDLTQGIMELPSVSVKSTNPTKNPFAGKDANVKRICNLVLDLVNEAQGLLLEDETYNEIQLEFKDALENVGEKEANIYFDQLTGKIITPSYNKVKNYIAYDKFVELIQEDDIDMLAERLMNSLKFD